jgi:CheY-like chemotaxis protein/signal transduction histidine kinase
MTGVEIISADLTECESRVSSSSKSGGGALSREYVLQVVDGIRTAIANIKDTNAFMLMTINRCLDYTKASQGLKLVPKYETVFLQEALQLPLNCMRNVQNKIRIRLAEYPTDICSHLITDRQWLQENILCLLSNAVKYSAGGEAVISIRLLLNGNQHLLEGKKSFATTNNTNNKDDNDKRKKKKPAPLALRVEPEEEEDDEEALGGLTPYKNSSSSSLRIKKQISLAKSDSKRSSAKIAPNNDNDDEESSSSSDDESSAGISQKVDNEKDKDKDNGRSTFLETSSVTSGATTTATPSEVLLIEVADNGIGMSEEAMKSLFNPFKQTQKLAGGTGLGLYSLAKRIEALKGEYGVHRRADKKNGSVFWFTIPYRPDQLTASLQPPPPIISARSPNKNNNIINPLPSPSSITSSPSLLNVFNADNDKSPHQQHEDNAIRKFEETKEVEGEDRFSVIIAEDTHSIAKMTTMMLRRQGHTTQVAENGQLLVDAYLKSINEKKGVSTFDVILMDLQMPVMDGLEATKRIRRYEKHLSVRIGKPVHILIIGVSANSDDETVTEAKKAGIDDFLPKPFSMNLFVQIVKKFL